MPSGPNASLQEFPRKVPVLRDDAVPCFLPGCPTYLSAPVGSKHSKRLKFEEKEEHFFTRVIQESHQSFKADEEKYCITTLDALKQKLNLISLQNWIIWYSSDSSIHFLLPRLEKSRISIEASLSVNSDLVTTAFYEDKPISLSLNALNDIRQVEALLIEIVRSSVLKSGSETDSIFYHIRSAKGHIIDAIDEIEECTAKDLKLNIEDNVISTYLPRLQFTLGQIEDIIVPKSRRRYNIITQVLIYFNDELLKYV